MRTLALLADPSGVLRRLKRWRGGLGSAALALALLAGQSGALLHEFSHYASALAAASESKAPKSDHDGKLCDICLASRRSPERFIATRSTRPSLPT
jgi:hypothetical protein